MLFPFESLNQWFSKWSINPWKVPGIQNYCYTCLFDYVNICTDGSKTMVGEATGGTLNIPKSRHQGSGIKLY